jgi:hypothetical protein
MDQGKAKGPCPLGGKKYKTKEGKKVNLKQLETGTKLVENLHKKGILTQMEYWEIEGAFHDISLGKIHFFDTLQGKAKRVAKEILETIGVWKKEKPEWTCTINSKTTGIPWIWRGREAKILDCEEIDEEAEMYTYHLEMEYNGRIYRTWINSEDVEI